MVLDKLHIIITILAAIVMAAACALLGYPLEKTAAVLSVTIVCFLVIGLAVRGYAKRNLVSKKDEPEAAAETDETEEPTSKGIFDDGPFYSDADEDDDEYEVEDEEEDI